MLRNIHNRRTDFTPLDPKEEKRHLYVSLFIPIVLIMVMVIVHFSSFVFDLNLNNFGIYPRHPNSLTGILTAPFIHGSVEHLLLNASAFFVLGFLLFNVYRKVAYKVLLINYLVGGLLLWIVGRPAWHIGMSGIIYGMAYFIFFAGLFRSDVRSLALSLLVAFLYAGFIWGIFPIDPKVSWEGHLMGALTGTVLAWFFRNVDRPELIEWDDQDENGIEKPYTNVQVNYSQPENNPRPRFRIVRMPPHNRPSAPPPNKKENSSE